MSQKSEDSIERFFRKGAVQQDKTFMERDWQRMEAMLDEHAIALALANSTKMKTATRIVAVVSMISFLFLVGVENNIAEHTTDDVSERTVQMQAAVGMVVPRIEGVEVKNEKPAADLHSSFEIKKSNPSSSDVNGNGKSRSANRPTRAQKKFMVASIPQLDGSSARLLTGSNIQNETNILPGSTSKLTIKSKDGRDFTNEVSGGAFVALSRPIDCDPVVEVEPDPLEEEEFIADEKKSEETEASPANKSSDGKSYPKVILTALISPDFSTTSLSRYSKPTGLLGFLIGYRISKRLTVMAGATKSLKRYEGYGQEYSPPAGYWKNRTNGVVPDEVEGQCGIIEVPVMVQFDMVQKPKSRLFISAGVSSYFMRNEHYDYTFHEPNPGAANSWTAKEPSDYLFKIGHLSAGYDRMVGKKLAIGIEPFLKVPFQGIGWTHINLYTTGAYINLRYTILSIHKD